MISNTEKKKKKIRNIFYFMKQNKRSDDMITNIIFMLVYSEINKFPRSKYCRQKQNVHGGSAKIEISVGAITVEF